MNEHFPVLSGSYEKRVEKGKEKKKENPGNRIGFLKKLGRNALPYLATAGSFLTLSSVANSQKGDKILNDATYTQLKNNEGKVGVKEGDTVHVLKVKQKREGKKTVIKEKGDVKILNNEVEKVEYRDNKTTNIPNQNPNPNTGPKNKINIGGSDFEEYHGSEAPSVQGKPKPGFTFQNGKWFKKVESRSETKTTPTPTPTTNPNTGPKNKINIGGSDFEEYHGSEPPAANGLTKPGFLFKGGVWYKKVN